jgi:hypothetical protein
MAGIGCPQCSQFEFFDASLLLMTVTLVVSIVISVLVRRMVFIVFVGGTSLRLLFFFASLNDR